jgi:alpha,alpha-trehalose-phosphate synthase [UDP-forming]
MWTKDALQDLIHTKLSDHRFLVVANREPYQHRFKAGRIECAPPPGGVVSALDPILRATGGTWVAHGSGNADRATADGSGRLRVPPDNPEYTLRRVWLTKDEEVGYYYGLANSGLWPLCHKVFTRPIFNPKHWPIYCQVNDEFASAVLEEAASEPAFVFIQDYHFGLLPGILREKAANLILGQFWHIPWPSPDLFEVFPWKEELLSGVLGNDLLAFQLRSHCLSFLNTVDRILEAKVDYERFEITRAGHTTVVRPFPISIDFDQHIETAQSPRVEQQIDHWREQLGLENELLGIGIDRIDYTKGIPERLRAIDRFLELHPDFRDRLVFVQIGVPSRTHIRHYQELDGEIDGLVERINWKWCSNNWRPIVYLKQQHSPIEMIALHRMADFCIVSSLDDGMNLVAKEFVASRTDEDGVLILSNFTGAARELTSAVLVNPFSIDEMAEAISIALTMPEDDRRKRMQKLREAVSQNNIYRWAGKFLSALLKFDFPEYANGNGSMVEAHR